MTHPLNFFAAHYLYSGRAFPKGPVWGALSDGPEERRQVIDRINELDDASLATVRVWHFQDDVPARDVTEDMLAEAARIVAEMENAA